MDGNVTQNVVLIVSMMFVIAISVDAQKVATMDFLDIIVHIHVLPIARTINAIRITGNAAKDVNLAILEMIANTLAYSQLFAYTTHATKIMDLVIKGVLRAGRSLFVTVR